MLQTTIAVVNYNTRDRLRECLASIIADGPNHVIVVDNSSSDGSAEMVRAEFADVELIANRYNSGYGAALNRALEHVTSQYTIALNGDTVLSRGSVRALETYLNAHPNAVIVGPRLRMAMGHYSGRADSFLELCRGYWITGCSHLCFAGFHF